MVRTQVMLAEDQLRALRQLAARQGVSISELVRRSVDRLIEEDERRKRWARSLEAIGKFHSGRSDISVNHDKYAWED